jgi:glyoxylase-like metal-dependent hydrolase (beta-lactamase superfamily II)
LTTGHVLTGKKGPQPAPFTLEPDLALESLGKLESVQATWLLPGHGAPWRGAVVDALGQVRAAGAA